MYKIIVLLMVLTVICGCATSNSSGPVSPGKVEALPASSRKALTTHQAAKHIFADPDWFQWGGSCVLGDDGKYHLFYARWPRSNPRGMLGWLYVSEIARAVADQPEGPYEYVETVLKGLGDEPAGRWDAINAHNPSVTRLRDPKSGKMKYYLYFIANRDDNTMNNDWWDHIINQRIGVAISDTPQGPWKRHTEPVCVPHGILQKYIVNPGVCQLPDGRFLLLLKGRYSKEKDPAGKTGPLAHGWALSDKPTGPFKIQKSLLFPATLGAEDPCVWVKDDIIYAAVKDWSGEISGTAGISWIYGKVEKSGSIKWTIPKNCSLSAKKIVWDDGVVTKLDANERPQILQDKDGNPTHLFTAVGALPIFKNARKTPRKINEEIPIENLPFNLCQKLIPIKSSKKVSDDTK